MGLLPVYEFTCRNPVFPVILLEDLDVVKYADSPWIGSFLNLASHLFTHASSSSSPRTVAYANLTLEMLLLLVENEHTVGLLTEKSAPNVSLCRQVCNNKDAPNWAILI